MFCSKKENPFYITESIRSCVNQTERVSCTSNLSHWLGNRFAQHRNQGRVILFTKLIELFPPPTPPVISSSALASSSAWKESALVIRAINFNENLDSRCPNPLLQTTIFRNRRRLNPALLRLSRDREEGGMMTVARDKNSTNRSRRLPFKKGILRQGLH